MNPIEMLLLFAAMAVVWLILATLALTLLHGASVLREESRSHGGVRRSNLPRSWTHSLSRDGSRGRRTSSESPDERR